MTRYSTRGKVKYALSIIKHDGYCIALHCSLCPFHGKYDRAGEVQLKFAARIKLAQRYIARHRTVALEEML